MKKIMNKIIAIILTIAIVVTGMVVPKETVSAAHYGSFEYYIHKNVEGDTYIVGSKEEEQNAIDAGKHYVWENDSTLLRLKDLYSEMEELNNSEALAFIEYQTAFNSAGQKPSVEAFSDTLDVASYNTALATYAPEPQLSNFAAILDPVAYQAALDFLESIEPIESDYTDGLNTLLYDQLVKDHAELVPIRENFTTDEEFNTAYATWESQRPLAEDYMQTAHEIYEFDHLVWSQTVLDPADYVLKTADEQFQESHNNWLVNIPRESDYYIAGSGQAAYETAVSNWESLFEGQLITYNQASANTLAKFDEFVELLEYFRRNIILGEDSSPVTTSAELTAVERKIIERKGSEEVVVNLSLEDGSKAPINVINSIQGYRCQEIFDAKAKECEQGTKVVRTYSFHAEGSTDKNPIYSTEDKVVISMTIPETVRQAGATYTFICVSENGESYVFPDEDNNANTITITTDKFYAYALCVTPATSN